MTTHSRGDYYSPTVCTALCWSRRERSLSPGSVQVKQVWVIQEMIEAVSSALLLAHPSGSGPGPTSSATWSSASPGGPSLLAWVPIFMAHSVTSWCTSFTFDSIVPYVLHLSLGWVAPPIFGGTKIYISFAFSDVDNVLSLFPHVFLKNPFLSHSNVPKSHFHTHESKCIMALKVFGAAPQVCWK